MVSTSRGGADLAPGIRHLLQFCFHKGFVDSLRAADDTCRPSVRHECLSCAGHCMDVRREGSEIRAFASGTIHRNSLSLYCKSRLAVL